MKAARVSASQVCSLLSIATILLSFATPLKSLTPRESEVRQIKSLDGVWNFRISNWWDPEQGFHEKWYLQPLKLSSNGLDEVIPMPVPSSFNDVTQNATIHDFIGWAWYEKEFFASSTWLQGKSRVILHFGSAHYQAVVFLNGVNVVNHTGGHLPFQVDVTGALKPLNRLTVALDNTLTPDTIPQGVVHRKSPPDYPPGYAVQSVNFDFYNYAGIHRSVILYSVPKTYIDDITIVTDVLEGNIGIIKYNISYFPRHTKASCLLTLLNQEKELVGYYQGCEGTIKVVSPHLWWPYTLHPNPGYLYTLKVEVQNDVSHDIYYQPVGIRSVKITDTSFLINNRPFYFTGFGKHEDANIRGKGLDIPLIIKDFNLIRWIGANSFRTSHYPYAEEIMDQADQQGIVVIDECPAVELEKFKKEKVPHHSAFNDNLLKLHKKMIEEMIHRDKNHPSVVMWSIANEPESDEPQAGPYFKEIAAHTKKLDASRPITAAISYDCQTELAGQYLDVVMINRYLGWYSDTGHPEVIFSQLPRILDGCHSVYRKLILMSEYGADTIAGLHQDPPFMFTEDFQTNYIAQYHQVFDILRQRPDSYFVGELIWNFADFMTGPGLTRIVGNKKGIFTRERQPKAAARLLRCRYLSLANLTSTLDSMEIGDLYCPAKA